MEEHQADIVVGCESHLDNSFSNYEIFPSQYIVVRKDRCIGGGGVFLALKSHLTFVEEPSFYGNAEMVWVKLCLNKYQPIFVCSLYRPPGSSPESLIELNDILTTIHEGSVSPAIILAGDFNLPDLKFEDGIGYVNRNPTYGYETNSLFVEMMNNYGFEQFVTQPTREDHILDLFLSTHPDIIENVQVVPGISDHEAVTCQLVLPSDKQISNNLRKVYQYHRADVRGINEELNNFTTSFLTNRPYENTVEDNWQQFKDTLLYVVDKYVPSKHLSTRKHLPWINKSIKVQMKLRKSLYDKAKQTQAASDWAAYRKARNQVNKALSDAHQQYCTHLFDNTHTNNNKRFWSLVKQLKKNYQSVPTLSVENELKTSPSSKAEALNQQFYSVFTRENNNIPPIGFTKFTNMANIEFTTQGIVKILRELKPGKSAGPDNIPTWVLKEFALLIAPVLQVIYTQSYQTGILPNDWLTANIVPVYKKGDKSTPANYRPISLTSVCCKTMEHIICHSILDHLNTYNIINPIQHGFRPGLSCQTQLILLVDEILRAMDQRYQVDLIMLDFSKAFDTVAHKKLLRKLEHYGIESHTHLWIQTWLTNRTQKVVVEGEMSEKLKVLSGVPQGTVLGPLMFLLYVNDISTGIRSSIRLFADDCVLYRVIETTEDHNILQQDLNTLVEWSNQWQMTLNPDKCVIINCTRSLSPSSVAYSINNTVLKSVEQHKYLGVLLHNSMSWSNHIQEVINKASKTLNFVKRTLYQCEPSVKATAYTTLVRPILEYASVVWDPHQQYLIDKIEMVQRRAARWVKLDYRQTSSVSDMMDDLQWPTLLERRKYSRLTIFYKFLHHDPPDISIPEYYLPHSLSHITRLSHHQRLIPPLTSCNYYQKSFFPLTITDWNKLPNEVIECSTQDEFLYHLNFYDYV